jgi:thiamine pyrophosphate-dependent acetolactate synthase large subunit-like protein
VAEIDTMTRHKVPVIALVGNDAAWSQIAREQVPMFGSSVACNLSVSTCFVRGCVGKLVILLCIEFEVTPYIS